MKLANRCLTILICIELICNNGVCVASPGMADAGEVKSHSSKQQSFTMPDEAVLALVAAIRTDDTKRIHQILGPGSSKLIHSGDTVADNQARDRFVAAFDLRWKIERNGATKATLLLGENDWPLPFPLVKTGTQWRFDAKSGEEEILNRHIGRNELAAIQVCLAYVDAQREYALKDSDNNGIHDYAMKLDSTPGVKDGLYWPTQAGESPSPLGPLVAKAKTEGYGSTLSAPYHGYLYKVMTGQGKDAPGGAYDYIVNGKMIGGFALVAYPARWGVSGIMTFIVNHDGVVFQNNLGNNTVEISSRMTHFNPDSTWTKARP